MTVLYEVFLFLFKKKHLTNSNDYDSLYPRTYHNVLCFLPLHMEGPLPGISSILLTCLPGKRVVTILNVSSDVASSRKLSLANTTAL